MSPSAPILLVVHLLWAGWMVTGVILSVAGFKYRCLWRFTILRTAHLLGLLATATVPLWNRGVCPLTAWEWQTKGGISTPESFVIGLIRSILYLDVPPGILVGVTGLGAGLTLWIFLRHPPWRQPGIK